MATPRAVHSQAHPRSTAYGFGSPTTAEAMDTGVRVNVALAQALGVEVPERLRPEEGARGPDDEASCCAADESDNESIAE